MLYLFNAGASTLQYGAGGQKYRYIQQLLNLARCTPSTAAPHPASSVAIVTPLRWRAWEAVLRRHPDSEFVRYIVDGVSQGFRVGFDYNFRSSLRSCRRNMGSAYDHPDVISAYLEGERANGRIIGPVPSPPGSVQVSSFGVIPKRHQPGKWRLILDLSSPCGGSVNDGIRREWCSLSYVSVADIASVILSMGRGSLIAKTDVKHAYRQIPIHPDDRWLLGMRWNGQLFLDATLPFGLRSAPIIFTAVADALEWVVRTRGASHIFHYVDDFVVVGPPESVKCSSDLELLLQTCADLGVEVAEDKTEGPSTCLTVLGIELDSVAMELRLPQEKLTRLRDALTSWRGRRSGIRKDLESLVGLLQHASQVVRPGRIFLRRLYNLLAQIRSYKPHHSVRLNAEAQADLEWWSTFLLSWNGTSILRPVTTSNPDIDVWSDASGSWGCGALWQTRWLQVSWDSWPIASASISAKELFPIVVAAAVWGAVWRGLTVCFHCDNMAVVEVLNRQAAKEPLMCHQLRTLFYLAARFDFDVTARHTPGVSNVAADAISRNNISLFLSQVPRASLLPTHVPQELISGLSSPSPAWRSHDWTNWFATFMATL